MAADASAEATAILQEHGHFFQNINLKSANLLKYLISQTSCNLSKSVTESLQKALDHPPPVFSDDL